MKNILIVDDDAGFRCMLFSHLHPNHKVSVLCNGKNALSVLADPHHGFDVVLLDLRMPGIDGKNVMGALNDWSGLSVKFIIISGMANEAELLKIPSVVGVLNKPFGLRDLDAMLKKIPTTSAVPKMRTQILPHPALAPA